MTGLEGVRHGKCDDMSDSCEWPAALRSVMVTSARQRPLPPQRGGATRFFFAHLGTLVSIVLFIVVSQRAGWSAAGVTGALWIVLALHSAYLALAWRLDEHKQFDLALWGLFAVGAVAGAAGIDIVVDLYRRYFGTVLFTVLGATALLPLLLGRDPFTVWHAVRQTPRWQHGTPAFDTANAVLAGFWSVLFFICALLCAVRPTDPMFTLVYPNLLILIMGMPATYWLLPLWFKLFPPAMPNHALPMIMGMPFVFNRVAAGDARAVIQFRVSGDEPFDCYLRVHGGRCESFEGTAEAADLVIDTPDTVWMRIAKGELDGVQALSDGYFRCKGDPVLLGRLGEWFTSAPRS